MEFVALVPADAVVRPAFRRSEWQPVVGTPAPSATATAAATAGGKVSRDDASNASNAASDSHAAAGASAESGGAANAARGGGGAAIADVSAAATAAAAAAANADAAATIAGADGAHDAAMGSDATAATAAGDAAMRAEPAAVTDATTPSGPPEAEAAAAAAAAPATTATASLKRLRTHQTHASKAHKQRRTDANESGASAAPKLCFAVLFGRACDKVACPYEHSAAALAAHVAAMTWRSLPGPCPVQRALGHCPHGVQCVFRDAHLETACDDSGAPCGVRVACGDRSAAATATLPHGRVACWQGAACAQPEGHEGVSADDAIGVYRNGEFANLVHYKFTKKLQRNQLKTPRADAYLSERKARIDAAAVARGETVASSGGVAAAAPSATTTSTTAAAAAAAAANDAVEDTADAIDDVASTAAGDSAVAVPATSSSNLASAAFDALERRELDVRGKLVLAPLTTVGTLPFRKICTSFGADVTLSEMAVAHNLLRGVESEWRLLARDISERCFGVQLALTRPQDAAAIADVLTSEETNFSFDFIDVNACCPMGLIVQKGGGSALCEPGSANRLRGIVHALASVSRHPITVKMRTGGVEDKPTAHAVLPTIADHGLSLVFLHGRFRRQRYHKPASWSYIRRCLATSSVHVVPNGDLYSPAQTMQLVGGAPLDANGGRGLQPLPVVTYADDATLPNPFAARHASATTAAVTAAPASGAIASAACGVWPDPMPRFAAHWSRPPGWLYDVGRSAAAATAESPADELAARFDSMMIGRGALIKPWIFSEIKESRHIDISSTERLDMLRSFCCTGLQLWGADQKGVDHTRIMLLEWLSFLHRYVPVGLLERPDALITDRKVPFAGRDELETLFASPLVDDWRAVASLLLGPERGPLHWKPRHNSYANVDQDAENNG